MLDGGNDDWQRSFVCASAALVTATASSAAPQAARKRDALLSMIDPPSMPASVTRRLTSHATVVPKPHQPLSRARAADWASPSGADEAAVLGECPYDRGGSGSARSGAGAGRLAECGCGSRDGAGRPRTAGAQ